MKQKQQNFILSEPNCRENILSIPFYNENILTTYLRKNYKYVHQFHSMWQEQDRRPGSGCKQCTWVKVLTLFLSSRTPSDTTLCDITPQRKCWPFLERFIQMT